MLGQSTLTVEVREGSDPAKATLKGFHGFDHLKEVTVQGKVVAKDDKGNVIVAAERIHVR